MLQAYPSRTLQISWPCRRRRATPFDILHHFAFQVMTESRRSAKNTERLEPRKVARRIGDPTRGQTIPHKKSKPKMWLAAGLSNFLALL